MTILTAARLARDVSCDFLRSSIYIMYHVIRFLHLWPDKKTEEKNCFPLTCNYCSAKSSPFLWTAPMCFTMTAFLWYRFSHLLTKVQKPHWLARTAGL